jgi:hypothetical protein
MTLANAQELADVLREADRLGLVFARHAYGMREWADLFGARIRDVTEPEAKALVARIVADNARHMLLFRERARAHGVDPDAYAPPPEGDAIYRRIPQLRDVGALAGYAIGSLENFLQLLAVYRVTATDPRDVAVIEEVVADTERSIAALAPLAGAGGDAAAREAHELYRRRELVEPRRYRDAA